MPNWEAIRTQVHALLRNARDFQPGLTLKAQLRGLTLEEVTADAITALVRRELTQAALECADPVAVSPCLTSEFPRGCPS
jgi:hypothetical protein